MTDEEKVVNDIYRVDVLDIDNPTLGPDDADNFLGGAGDDSALGGDVPAQDNVILIQEGLSNGQDGMDTGGDEVPLDTGGEVMDDMAAILENGEEKDSSEQDSTPVKKKKKKLKGRLKKVLRRKRPRGSKLLRSYTKFIRFEKFNHTFVRPHRPPGVTGVANELDEGRSAVHSFLEEWDRRLNQAQDMGCQYSDQVLAFKLIQKASLARKDVVELLASITREIARRLANQVTEPLNLHLLTVEYFLKSDSIAKHFSERAKIPPKSLKTVKTKTEPGTEMRRNILRPPEMKREEEKVKVEIAVAEDLEDDLLDYINRVRNRTRAQKEEKIKANMPSADDSNASQEVCWTCNTTNCPHLRVDVMNDYIAASERSRRSYSDADDSMNESMSNVKDEAQDANETHCGECNKTFNNPDLLAIHRRQEHSEDRPYMCTICAKTFPRKGSLIKHENVHTRPYVCEVCGKSYAHERNYSVHMATHASGGALKPYSCEYCYKKFSSTTGLQGHMNLHIGHKPFTCHICGAGFAYKSMLKHHIQLHEAGKIKSEADLLREQATKKFKCDQCSVGVMSSKALRLHKEAVHEGVRFPCDLCPYLAKRAKNLIEHKTAVHDGIKYKCDHCNYQAGWRSQMRKHMKSHMNPPQN